jgi:hypothetical protein
MSIFFQSADPIMQYFIFSVFDRKLLIHLNILLLSVVEFFPICCCWSISKLVILSLILLIQLIIFLLILGKPFSLLLIFSEAADPFAALKLLSVINLFPSF